LKKNTDLASQNAQLLIEKIGLEKRLKEPTDLSEEHWNNRKPKADVLYQGRSVPTDISTQVSIDVRQFVTDNDFEIFEDLRRNNLLAKQNADIPLNDLVLKIYKHTRLNYNYSFDDQLFKIGELWMFPFELRYYKKGDCDDYAIELASYLIMAGIPYWRVRCVAGTTWGDFGHLTVYVLGDDMKTWYHINSTTPLSMITQNRLEDMPKSNDSNDNIGIRDVWFSFNNLYSWSVFETSSAENEFKKDLSRLVKITPFKLQGGEK
jgi:hypothetical protein